MKHITLKEIRQNILNKHLLLDTFVDYKKFHYPSGKAVFDIDRGLVIRQVSNNYKLITNEDLVKWIKASCYSVRFLDIYKTKSQDTVYIEGYLPEFLFEDACKRKFYISFEIVNSYSSRFLPAIHLGISYLNFPSNIKTNIKITPNSRNNLLDLPFNPDLANALLEFIQSEKTYPIIESLLEELIKNLPKKLHKLTSVIISKQFNRNSPVNYLEVCALIANVWKKTSYELARVFQMQQYSYLIERISSNDNN